MERPDDRVPDREFRAWYLSAESRTLRLRARCSRCGRLASLVLPLPAHHGPRCQCAHRADPCGFWQFFLRERLREHFSEVRAWIQGACVRWSSSEAYELSGRIARDVEAPGCDYEKMYRLHVVDFIVMSTIGIPRTPC